MTHPEVEMIQDFEGQQLQTQLKEFFKPCFRVVIHPSLGMEAAGRRSERSRWRRKNEHETWQMWLEIYKKNPQQSCKISIKLTSKNPENFMDGNMA